MGMNVREAFQRASSFLRGAGVESPEFEAELLLRRFLGVDRARFFLLFRDPWQEEWTAPFQNWLNRRAAGEPLQYIIGDQEFYGRLFQVNPSVLIPRPETEGLVETVLEEAERFLGKRALHVVDVGTGSGAIAITLALEKPEWQVTAIDLSSEALATAKDNAHRHGVKEKITWIHGSYLTPLLPDLPTIDVLVSNPPYIPSAVIPALEKQVQAFEPRLALDGGEDGLEPYRVLTEQFGKWSGKRLVCFEIGADQGGEVAGLVKKISGAERVEIRQDLAGRDRVVIGFISG
ncbi:MULTISPECIES: peptide chain release factor N(5)-glutamine methyltransferase [Thermoactinomyces]|jgi:release factor glutamine methyltransferase|uniref:Release factor glutamine methyltransferase n=1 Tax=Thermoactinomyces daqus TaxID=1329516 RepID=A0A7W1X860_9BACL|nr:MULTISPECIES: peptide chain release factor N(5)-glutamine methyltransferase [Thermoactinomyces]MBA4541853.1 peptide chain release factor N(5)-glutamine methyltransferase [Thermoactinomyces daqus]MBH8597850.1 peptide chain release factor N(5)-glutamine methyltransferase [Thermoactinomyces sp. CICC 10523]MBH8604202.1 peptide chain release factor N(5)-glutamine methyltransferase [Thermoactinomyces sp. CICC 10522]MBH8608076.1 peptide chain release factor N(5)-glutamine methyltransferase [Thermoa